MLHMSVFVGSLREQSYHRALFNTYARLAQTLCTFTEIPTQDFVWYNGDMEAHRPAVIDSHAATIRASAGVLFFTPEYNYSIPGHLKNALDWLSRVPNQPFDDKKAAIIGGSPGAIGSARMQYALRQVGVALNMHFLNRPEVMVSALYEKFDDNMVLIDTNTIDFLKKHIEAFYSFVQKG